jgi:leucyl-tRNA synthetase
MWRLCQHQTPAARASGEDKALQRITHRTIQRVTEEVDAFKFNTALAALMEAANALEDHRRSQVVTPAFLEATGVLIRLLAPMAPHIAEELWARRGGAFSVHQQPWPDLDPALAEEETITLVVQVNGRVRDRIAVPRQLADQEARARALESPAVQQYLKDRTPRRVIVVPGRLVNVVV